MDRNPQIMIFGSHSPARGEPEYEGAVELGRALVKAGFDVASGGYGGTMEAVLKGAHEAGREGIAEEHIQCHGDHTDQDRRSGVMEGVESPGQDFHHRMANQAGGIPEQCPGDQFG